VNLGLLLVFFPVGCGGGAIGLGSTIGSGDF